MNGGDTAGLKTLIVIYGYGKKVHLNIMGMERSGKI